MRILWQVSALVCATAILSACSGGSGSVPQRSSSKTRTGTLSISFKDASAAGAAARARSKRSRQLNIETESFAIAINGGTPVYLKTGVCSTDTTGAALVCPAQNVTAPSGNDSISVSTMDEAGNTLESGTITANVVAGSTTPVAISLDGSVANVVSRPIERRATAGHAVVAFC